MGNRRLFGQLITSIRIRHNNKPDEAYCIDLNGTIILSRNIQPHNFIGNDKDDDHIYFSFKKRNWIYYYLKYNKEEKRFFWYRNK